MKLYLIQNYIFFNVKHFRIFSDEPPGDQRAVHRDLVEGEHDELLSNDLVGRSRGN